MNGQKLKAAYLIFVALIFAVPNIAVTILGFESFPLTCAPMFAHHIDVDTELYSLKFEGRDPSGALTDLIDHYGKSEVLFERHFFAKVYGSVGSSNPFSDILCDNEELFHQRAVAFFNNYSSFLRAEYDLEFPYIVVSAKRMYQFDNADFEPLGYFDAESNSFHLTNTDPVAE